MNNKKIVLIDGYNAIHKIPELEEIVDKNLKQAREGLKRYCSRWLSSRKDVSEFIIVFDGRSQFSGMGSMSEKNIRVIFTEDGETADERIINIIQAYGGSRRYIAVSNDNFVKRGASLEGAQIMSVREFLNSFKKGVISKKNTLEEELTPAQKKTINDELMKEWG
ncbi:NYN domain-containing protein [Verrucomicrobiota bacterium]